MNYNETIAAVVKHTSIRVLLSIVAHLDLEIHQTDVVIEFLDGELKEKVCRKYLKASTFTVGKIVFVN